MNTPHEDTTAASGEQGAGNPRGESALHAPCSLHPARLNLIVPQEVRYDGVQESPTGDHHFQFTDHGKGPAYGATFYVPIAGITNQAIISALIAKRRAFRTTAAPLIRPLHQRRPVAFVTGGEIFH